MAVSVSNFVSFNSNSTPTTTFSYTVIDPTQPLIAIIWTNFNQNITAVTFGAQSFVPQFQDSTGFLTLVAKATVWLIQTPTVGTSTVTVTNSAICAGALFQAHGGPVDGQFILPVMHDNASGTTALVKAATYQSDDLVIASVYNRSSRNYTATSGTQLYSDTTTTTVQRTAMSSIPGGTNATTLSWGLSGSSESVAIALVIPAKKPITGGTKQFLSGSFSTSGGSSYAALLCASGDDNWDQRLLANLTIRNIQFESDTDPGVQTFTFEIYRHNQPTGITRSITGTNRKATFTDVNFPVYKFGSTVVLSTTTSGIVTGSYSYEFEFGENCSIYGNTTLDFLPSSVGASAKRSPIQPLQSNWSVFPLQEESVVGITSGAITELYAIYQSELGTGVYDFVLYKNGVIQDGTSGSVDTTVTLNGSGTSYKSQNWRQFNLPVVLGDRVYCKVTLVSGSAGLRGGIACRVEADEDHIGEFMISGSSGSPNAGSARFSAPDGAHTIGSRTTPWSTPESAMDLRMGPLTTPFEVTGFYLEATTAPGLTKSYTFTLRKNGANVAGFSTAILSGTATITSMSGSEPYVESDLLALESVPASTPGSLSNCYYTLRGYMIPGREAFARVTQAVLLVGYDEEAEPPPTENDCTGGGVVDAGTDPSAGASIATAESLHVKVTATIGATSYSWAKVAINHGTAPSAVRVDSIGKLNIGIGVDGGLEGVSVVIKLFDHDNLLRGLHNTQTMLNQSMSIWVADLTTIIAAGSWQRKFRGVIRKFRPTPDGGYEVTLEDPLTLSTSAFAQDKMVPVDLISIGDGTSDQGLRQAPLPVGYGSLNEEDGAWTADYVGTETLPSALSLGSLHKHLICKSPTSDVQSVHIGDPFSGTPPRRRRAAGASEYGTRIFVEHQTGWLFSTQYVVDPDTGIRLSVIYVEQHHPGADLARFDMIPITVNFCAREDVGDGTGTTIDKLVLQDLHFLNTEVAQRVLDTDWPAIAARDSYSLFKTSSWEAVAAIFATRLGDNGALGACIIGHSHRQISLRDRLEQASCYGYFERFWNQDGQLEVTTLDRTLDGTGAVHFTAEREIKENSFSIDPCDDQVENHIQYVYRRKYAKGLEQFTPGEGERLPPDSFQENWFSGLLFEEDATSIGQLASGTSDDGIRKSKVLELECVRDEDTAHDIIAQRLDLRSPRNGRAEATFTVRLQDASTLTLGDIVKVTHPQGLGTNGWVAQRCQLRRRIIDFDLMEETLTVRDIDDLLGSFLQLNGDQLVLGGNPIVIT